MANECVKMLAVKTDIRRRATTEERQKVGKRESVRANF